MFWRGVLIVHLVHVGSWVVRLSSFRVFWKEHSIVRGLVFLDAFGLVLLKGARIEGLHS